jgi:hypothetical protein
MSNDILSCQPLLPPCLLDLKVHRKRMRRIDRRTDRQTKDKGKQKSGSSAIEKHHRGENSKERTPEKSLMMMSERASAKCPIGKLEAIRLQSFFLSVAAASLPACPPARRQRSLTRERADFGQRVPILYATREPIRNPPRTKRRRRPCRGSFPVVFPSLYCYGTVVSWRAPHHRMYHPEARKIPIRRRVSMVCRWRLGYSFYSTAFQPRSDTHTHTRQRRGIIS